MSKTLFVLPALLLLACQAAADPASGYDFLLDEPAARAASLAGAVTADNGTLDALRYNPAGLAGLDGLQAAISNVDAMGDWTEDWAAVGADIGPAVLAGEVLVSNVAPFTLYDQNGTPVATAGAGNQNIGLGGALPVAPWLRFGADARYFRSQLYTYSSQGGALDLGAQLGNPDGPVTAGLSVQNLGLASAYISQSDPLPALLRLGLRGNMEATPGLTLKPEIDVVDYRDASHPPDVRLGAEAAVIKQVFLRAGWTQSGDFSEPSLGVGVLWHNFRLDYAYQGGGALGGNQLVELQINGK